MTRQLTLGDCPELFANLRELGYDPYFGNGHIEIDVKEEDDKEWKQFMKNQEIERIGLRH